MTIPERQVRDEPAGGVIMAGRWADHRAWAGAAVLLAAVLAGFFWRVLLMREVFYPGDIAYFYFPAFVYVSRSLRAGTIPLWCPELEGGMPLVALWETSVLYPVELLFRFWGAAWIGFNGSLLFHYLLAALGMLFYSRALGFTQLAGAASALIYTLSGFMVFHLTHVNMVVVAAWMPWLFFAVERLWERRRVVTLALAGGVVAMQLLGGHPDVTLMSAFAIGLYALLHPAHGLLYQKKWRSGLYTIASLGAAYALGVALAAGQLLPTLTLAAESWTRAQESLIVQRATILTPAHYWHFLLPDLTGRPVEDTYFGPGGYGEWCGYAGVLTLILALIGLVSRHRMTVFWTVCAGLGLLLAMGPDSDLFSLLREVPPFGTMRIPSRWVFLFDFGLALLAGAGLQALTHPLASRAVRRNLQWIAGALLVASVAIGLLLGRVLEPGGEWMRTAHRRLIQAHRVHALDESEWVTRYNRRLYGEAACLGLLLLVGNGLVWSRLRSPAMLPWAAPLGFAALSLDLFQFGAGQNALFPGREVVTVPSTAQRILAESAGPGTERLARAHSDLFQVFTAGHIGSWPPEAMAEHRHRFLEMLPGNANLVAPVPTFEQNISALRLRNWRRLRAAVWVRGGTASRQLVIESRLWPRHNVGFVLSQHPLALAGLTPLTRETPYLYRVAGNEGRAFFRSRAVTFPDDGPLFDRIATAPEVLAHTVLLSAEGAAPKTRESRAAVRREAGSEGGVPPHRSQPSVAPAPRSGSHDGAVALIREQPHHLEFQVRAPRDGYVVLTDAFYPGWKAWLDHRPAAIRRANGVHRAVAVPAGTHRLVFSYQPAAPRLGFFLSLLAVAGVAAMITSSWRYGSRPGDR